MSRAVRWLSVLVVLTMLAVTVPQTASSESLPTVTITEDTVLTADLNAHVVIGADGITLDGAGHKITGDGTGAGISLVGRTRVTIVNCWIGGFENGILLDSSCRNTLMNNIASGWLWEGFHLSCSDYNTLTGNTVCNNIGDGDCGFWLSYSDNNILTKNTADGRWDTGFYLWDDSHNNTLRENMAIFNGWGDNGFALCGSDNRATDNTASGGFPCGFHLYDIYNIRNNTACGCGRGFSGYYCSLRGNTACHNGIGFFVHGELRENLAIYNSVGFEVGRYSNVLIDNTANYNGKGFSMRYDCYYNMLIRNNASNNGLGFYFRNDLLYNTFIKNTALGNTWYDLTPWFGPAYSEVYGNVFVKNVFSTGEYPPNSEIRGKGFEPSFNSA